MIKNKVTALVLSASILMGSLWASAEVLHPTDLNPELEHLVQLMLSSEMKEKDSPEDIKEALVLADRLSGRKESLEMQAQTLEILKEILKELKRMRRFGLR